MKKYTKEELKEQKKIIMDILLSGDVENHRRLTEALKDEELHPQIRELIGICQLHVQLTSDLIK